MKAMVLGSGGWGTALALLLCDNGHEVSLWSHNPEKAEAMRKTRENPLLAGVPLPEALSIVSDIAQVKDADMVVFATPSFALRETARKAAPWLRPEQTLVSVTKGIERDSNLRMSEVLRQETGDRCKVVSLSGPSHAEEVGRRLPTGCVAACPVNISIPEFIAASTACTCSGASVICFFFSNFSIASVAEPSAVVSRSSLIR